MMKTLKGMKSEKDSWSWELTCGGVVERRPWSFWLNCLSRCWRVKEWLRTGSTLGLIFKKVSHNEGMEKSRSWCRSKRYRTHPKCMACSWTCCNHMALTLDCSYPSACTVEGGLVPNVKEVQISWIVLQFFFQSSILTFERLFVI